MGSRSRPEHVEIARHCRVKTLFIQVVVSVFAQVMASGLVLAQVLTHGPVVGGVTSSKARVFLRTDQEASVALCYGADPNLDTCQMSEIFQTRSARDFTKIILLSGLMPGTTFYLNVLVNGVPQLTSPPYPSFTTFPTAGSLRNFKFVVLTDFVPPNNLTSAVQTYASAAAEHPAFAFIGGDFDHRNPRTLSAKRRMFKDLYDANTPYMRDFVNLILKRIPIVHQWDDHDAGMNDVDKTYPDWNLTQQVFEEYVPRYPLPSVTPGIWQKFSYAQADFFVLDCRSQRDPKTDPDDMNKSMLDGNDLGTAGQLQWLEDGLLSSTARWKIIFTSVVINPTTKFPDGWAGYQTEWNSLKNFINTNNIQGVVFISGDLHIGAIDNGIQAGFPEMCVIQANGTVGTCPTGAFGVWSEGYYQDSCNGYSLVKILHNPDRLILQAMDQFGNVQISHTVR
jgi:alkaline phosphatase D